MKIALIGVGMVAHMHAEAIKASNGVVELAGVWARDPQKANDFAQDHRDIKTYATLQNLAEDSDLDFAIVLTPPDARSEISKILAASGVPTLMEKPIERDAAAASEIVEVFAAHNVPLGVVLQHRMRPAALQLKQQLLKGTLGPIGALDVRIPWWRGQDYYDVAGRGTYQRDGGGVLITQAIHTLDLMLHLAGPVTQVTALGGTTSLHQMEGEDFVSAGFQFQNGTLGSLTASTASFPGTPESISIHGAEGSAILDAASLSIHWRDGRIERIEGAAETGGGADPMAFGPEWHRDVIIQFAKAVKTGTAPAITGQDALSVHRLIDTMQLAMKTGQRQEVPHG